MSEQILEHWGKTIRSHRAGRSQTWLAEQVGVDQTTISRLENGRSNIPPDLLVCIAIALDCDPGELFTFPPGLVSKAMFELDKRRERVA